MEKTLTLDIRPAKYTGGVGEWKTFELASTVTTTSVSRGSSFTAYGSQPVQYLKDAIDAAKERMMFMQVVSQYQLPEGVAQISIPYRTKYLASGSWESSTAEYSAGSEISWTAINTNDAVQISPQTYNYGVALSNKNLRTNALNLLRYCQTELSYHFEDVIDSAIRDAILGTVDSSAAQVTAGATAMSNTVNGMQTIYGGDATDADNSLDAGDVITTDMIIKARRLLQSTIGYYWALNTFTKSATPKNPWSSDKGEPIVLFLAPEQMATLLQDPQFSNAAEFGARDPILNGEIAQYMGVKLIETTKVPAIASGDYISMQGGTQAFDTDAHMCLMTKAGKIAALVWGRKAELKTFDWPNADQVRMKLSFDYGVGTIHDDAAVRLVVADE